MGKTPDFKYNRGLGDIIRDQNRPKLIPETGHIKVNDSANDISPSFANGWTHVGADFAPASFYLSEDGEVRMRGHITGGTPGTVVFTLPEGYRPEYKETFITGNDGVGYCEISVDVNGDVTIERVTSS